MNISFHFHLNCHVKVNNFVKNVLRKGYMLSWSLQRPHFAGFVFVILLFHSNLCCMGYIFDMCNITQIQKAVPSYFSSKKVLTFDFALV